MITTCAYCQKICDPCQIERYHRLKEIDFCCYEHYLKFWLGTPGFVPLPKSQVKKIAIC